MLYLRNKNINFRRLTKEDLPFLLSVRNHESTVQFLENRKIFELDDCREWFKKLKDEWWVIRYKDTRVGYIRTSKVRMRLYVGCDIHPDYRGRGYASEAFLFLIRHYRRNLYLWVFLKNEVAINLYRKFHFKDTGRLKTKNSEPYIEMKYNGKI